MGINNVAIIMVSVISLSAISLYSMIESKARFSDIQDTAEADTRLFVEMEGGITHTVKTLKGLTVSEADNLDKLAVIKDQKEEYQKLMG